MLFFFEAPHPVGELQEICLSRRLQPPVYWVSLEEGVPHERNFVINCLAGPTFHESASGRSKKIAKRKVASKMLATLKAQPMIMGEDQNIGGFGGIGSKGLPTEYDVAPEIARMVCHYKGAIK